MRALSIRQPWAELIARGVKKIEYRTWSLTDRGELLVVASKSRHDDECRKAKVDPDSIQYGQAVCIVDLWKVTGEDGDYRWHVRDPRRVQPENVKGSASIYHVEDARIRVVSAAKERA